MKNRHDLLEATQQQLDHWDVRLTELERELDAKTDRAKHAARRELKRLRRQQQSLASRLEAAKHAAAEGWMQLEGDLSDAVKTFREGASRVLEEARR